MKRITILAATLFALSGLQAQTGIDGVLRNIETNNKELQANAQLIASQKLEARTDNNLPDPTPVSYTHLAVEFGGTTLFSDISFVINEKDRIALMGKNGAGKSTLLKILAGVRQPTRGRISAPKECVIAYLPQHLMTEDGRTVFEETAQAFAHLHEMEAEIERMNKELETRTDYESDSYMELIENVSALSEKFYAIDATNYEEDVEKALLGLGFMREDFHRQTSDFSGGWRMRIELAKLLLQKPDVLLLDEPTNCLLYTSHR